MRLVQLRGLVSQPNEEPCRTLWMVALGEGGMTVPSGSEKPDSNYRHHDATPGSGPDRSASAAVPDSFPASDPVATTAALGARAVDPAELFRSDDASPAGETTKVSFHFADQETAKLALESLVRDAPLDRRCATLRKDAAGVSVQASVPKNDADRISELMQRYGGKAASEALRHTVGSAGDDIQQGVAALRSQVEQLLRSHVAPRMAATAEAARSYGRETRKVTSDVTHRAAQVARERPLTALTAMAIAAFLVGRFSLRDRHGRWY
jgi:hypothetical protein